MDKKYQIFISSTYKDLIPEREKVRDVILSMYQFPIGMEMFSAADDEQWEIIKETIDSSDYYVLIIGKRYGSVRAEDIPDGVVRYVSSGDIRRYNEALPPKEEVEKYIQECEIYQRVKKNGIPLTFFVNNLGTAKATDISVSIEFPKEVQVFDIEKIKEMGEPTGPKLPENPIKHAYEMMERERALALDLKMPGKSVFEGFGSAPDISSLYRMPTVSANSIYESIDIEDNIVDIEIKNGLVHTKFLLIQASPFSLHGKSMNAEHNNQKRKGKCGLRSSLCWIRHRKYPPQQNEE